MKLNNKGFAISSMMYLILMMAIILIFLTLALLSSRKLILDKTKSEVTDAIYGSYTTSYREVLENLKQSAIMYVRDNQLNLRQSIKVSDLNSLYIMYSNEVLDSYKLSDKYITVISILPEEVYLGQIRAYKGSENTLTLNNMIDIIDYKFYGNSSQSTDASPSNPKEIKSVGTLITSSNCIGYDGSPGCGSNIGKYYFTYEITGNDSSGNSLTDYGFVVFDSQLRKIGSYKDSISYSAKQRITNIANCTIPASDLKAATSSTFTLTNSSYCNTSDYTPYSDSPELFKSTIDTYDSNSSYNGSVHWNVSSTSGTLLSSSSTTTIGSYFTSLGYDQDTDFNWVLNNPISSTISLSSLKPSFVIGDSVLKFTNTPLIGEYEITEIQKIRQL